MNEFYVNIIVPGFIYHIIAYIGVIEFRDLK